LSKKRVAITGLGVISPIGIGKDSFFKSLKEGKSGVDKITKFDTEGLSTKIAAEVRDFNPIDFIDKKEAKRMDRYTQFAVAASKMAIDDASLDINALDQDRFGVCIGSGIGGLEPWRISIML